jgi:sialate O-acetylesterase
MQASGPFELKVSSGTELKTFKDVMIGDVWLIAGQSNVALTLAATTDWAQAKKESVSDAIRVCKLSGAYAFEPEGNFSRPLSWDILNPARAGTFSGVGYYFVRTVQPAVGVTVGLVQAAVGGTQVEQWTPQAALKAAQPENPLFAVRDKARAKFASDPNARVGLTQAGATTLYNGTVHPFRFAKLKGVLWYQGETNARSNRDYRPVLTTFVKSWREVFDQPDLPFVIVQLPSYGASKGDAWMRVQEAQLLTARELGLPLVVTIDQGSQTTIHPPNKAEVGRRAGLAALQHVYKQNVEGTCPLPKDVKFERDSAIVEFDGFKGDLVLKGDTVKGFELAGGDGVFKPATAILDGRRVVVHADGVSQPKAVRYLWANSPEAVTLYSAAGLPAGPFRSTSTGLRDNLSP